MTTAKQTIMSDGWPEASQFKRSIRLEFSIYVTSIILLMMLITGFIVTKQYVDTVTDGVINTLLVQARAYSGPAGKHIITTDKPDALLLNNICKKLSDDNRSVFWAGISNSEGIFLAHTDISQVIKEAHLPQVLGSNDNSYTRVGEKFEIRGDTIFTLVPIIENGITFGQLVIASTADQINKASQKSIIAVLSITVIMMLIGLPVTMLILHRKLKPISLISKSLRDVNLEKLEFTIPVISRNEFGYLARTIEAMGVKLGQAQTHLMEKDRIARELEIAKELQTKILPNYYPKIEEYEFSGIYRSAREIGGDYYDFIEIDENRLAVLIADVSGKSLPGMLVMLLTRDIVRQQVRTTIKPAELLSKVNHELSKSIKKGMFVTMSFGVLDKLNNTMEFASAGHNPLIHIEGRTGITKLIKTKGYPLGLMPSGPFDKRIETGCLDLSENDWIIQYTDGINEAQSTSGEEYGMDRFTKSLDNSLKSSPEIMIQKTLDNLQDFVGDAEPYDDITLLAMKWYGKSHTDTHTSLGKLVNAN